MKTIVHMIWGEVGSGQTFCGQSRVGSTFRRVGSGPRKVTRGQLSRSANFKTQIKFFSNVTGYISVYELTDVA